MPLPGLPSSRLHRRSPAKEQKPRHQLGKLDSGYRLSVLPPGLPREFAPDNAHSPGMQYRTGGAIIATGPSRPENEVDFSLVKTQSRSNKQAYWSGSVTWPTEWVSQVAPEEAEGRGLGMPALAPAPVLENGLAPAPARPAAAEGDRPWWMGLSPSGLGCPAGEGDS